jgi:hypothetical protein
VGLDDVAELRVPGQQGELDDRLGARAAQPGLLQQDPLLLGVHELADVDTGRHGVVGQKLGDVGVYEVRAALAGQRDAMVAVLDEVGATDLEHRDGRHHPVWKRLAQPSQPAARLALARPKIAVEVTCAINRTDDPLDRNLAQAHIAPPDHPQSTAGLIKRQQTHPAMFPQPGYAAVAIGCSTVATMNIHRRDGRSIVTPSHPTEPLRRSPITAAFACHEERRERRVASLWRCKFAAAQVPDRV